MILIRKKEKKNWKGDKEIREGTGSHDVVCGDHRTKERKPKVKFEKET